MFVIFLLAVVAYTAASPDRRTLTASRGTAGAVRSGIQGAGAQLRADWHAGRPNRQRTYQGWRNGLRTRRAGTAALVAWDALRFGGKAVRGTGRYGYRAGRAAVESARPGFRTAAEQAQARRDAKRAARQARTQPGDEPTPSTPATDAGSTPTASPTPTDSPTTGEPDVNLLTIKQGELTNTSELRAENGELRGIIEELREVLAHLSEYLNGVGDRYASAPFGTEKLSRAIAGLGEQRQAVDPTVADHILEQVEALEEALTEADQLAEHASAVKAEGNVEAFQAA